MPRFASASVDGTALFSSHICHAREDKDSRLTHAVSAVELRGSSPSGYAASIARKRKGLQQPRRAASSFPLIDISHNARRSLLRSDSSFEKAASSFLLASECNDFLRSTPSSVLSNVEDAYPTPPASERGESPHATDSESNVCEAIDAFPFPLNPVPLPALKFSTTTNNEVPHTPTRRWASTGVQPPTPSPSSSPDRYISKRNTAQESSKTYRVSKSPHQLSVSEKLLRHVSASPDPFGPLVLPRIRNGRIATLGGPPLAVHPRPPRPIGTTNVTAVPGDPLTVQNRLSSAGAVWNIGGGALAQHSGPVRSVSNGRGGFISGGSNAPMYMSQFFGDDTSDQDTERMEARLAAALDIDQTARVLDISRSSPSPRSVSTGSIGLKRKRQYVEPRTRWRHGDWVHEGSLSLLDAPSLRDDYYCSVLAYCYSAQVLAVGLANRVYLWSEVFGVRYPPDDESARHSTYVTSLSFSSTEGGHSVLAIGRSSGQISLWSLHDPENIRFQSQQPCAIACVAFKPVTTRRPSERFGCMMSTEELLVGDEVGNVYYYSIEWMSKQQVDIHGWTGAMTLLAKITVHGQQICGLAWSPDGDYFATGANDNACCLFEVKSILAPPDAPQTPSAVYRSPLQTLLGGFGLPNFIARTRTHSEVMGILADGVHVTRSRVIPGHNGSLLVGEGRQKHKWVHSAAIKAVAFCPWQRGLIATGGGSNDRAIHFYHTFSGACLATINVHAQVTALIWSTTRREIAATFGYAQPDHPYRVAVFSWPDCKQIVAIPWSNDLRALYAISYPGGPGESTNLGETWFSRTKQEGCIVVACSDESVKFHEVWSGPSRSTGIHMGLLGGSDILESLEGIDKEGTEVIR